MVTEAQAVNQRRRHCNARRARERAPNNSELTNHQEQRAVAAAQIEK